MKKICSILISIGCLGVLAGAIFRLLHIDYQAIDIISAVPFLLGVILLPSTIGNKFKKLMLRQKTILTGLWLGILLVVVGHLLRLLHMDDNRYLFIAGSALLFLTVFYILIFRMADMLRIGPKGKPVGIATMTEMGLTNADLQEYVGAYTNEKIPLTITITEDNDTLIAQATNQSAFYLEVIGKNVFKYPKRDIVIEFDLKKNELILKQHGGYFLFFKEG